MTHRVFFSILTHVKKRNNLIFRLLWHGSITVRDDIKHFTVNSSVRWRKKMVVDNGNIHTHIYRLALRILQQWRLAKPVFNSLNAITSLLLTTVWFVAFTKHHSIMTIFCLLVCVMCCRWHKHVTLQTVHYYEQHKCGKSFQIYYVKLSRINEYTRRCSILYYDKKRQEQRQQQNSNIELCFEFIDVGDKMMTRVRIGIDLNRSLTSSVFSYYFSLRLVVVSVYNRWCQWY